MIELVEFSELSELEHRQILELRNQPHVREVSGTTHSITWEEHSAWLRKRNREDWAVIRGRVWGALHLTQTGRWGLYFDPEASPRLSVACSVALLDRAFETHNQVEALVLEGYERQIRFDLRLGMRLAGFEEVGGRRFHLLRMTREEWASSPVAGLRSRFEAVEWSSRTAKTP